MERVISSDIATEFMGSDHCPISLEIKLWSVKKFTDQYKYFKINNVFISQENYLLIVVDVKNLQLLVVMKHLHQFFLTCTRNIPLVDRVEKFLHLNRSITFLLVNVSHLKHDVRHRILLGVASFLLSLLASATLLIFQWSYAKIHKSDRFVDIALFDVVPQAQLCHGLRESNYAEQRSRSHIHVAAISVSVPLLFTFLDVLGDDVIV